MSYCDLNNSQDQAFLQNLQSFHQSNDIFNQICKVQTPLSIQNLSYEIKIEMQDQKYSAINNQNQRSSKNKSKDKKKIFYRDKMVQLMKNEDFTKQQYNYVGYTSYEKGKSPIGKQEQLKRNRQSAKNSRQRKKQYVTILEKKNEQHQQEIKNLTQQLREVTLERDRLREHNHTEIKTFLQNKLAAYEKLSKTLNDNYYPNELQIQYQLNEMFIKYGAAGTQRLQIINYYMNQILDLLVSDIHKYFLDSKLLQSVLPNKQPKRIDRQVAQILDLDQSKISYIMTKYKERFNKQTSVFKDLTQQFYRIFQSIQNQGKVIELIFIDLRKQLDSRKLSKLILWFQENKYCKDVKKIRSEWIENLVKGEQNIEIIRKQMKIDV